VKRLAVGVFLLIALAAPHAAVAVPDLRVTEHLVPATAGTGEVVEARVTVTNAGDTSTESTTEIEWQATNDEGFIMPDFVMRPAVCPAGSEDSGSEPTNVCIVTAPIAPGASMTAVFSGSSRYALVLQARAIARDLGSGVSNLDTQPLTISGPTLPEPAGPRVSHLTLEARRLHPGERAQLRFTLDRPAKHLYASLSRCLGRTGCRRARFVLNSVIARRGRRGPNTMRYPLPVDLASGRYRITVWAHEAFHREIQRSVTLRVLRRGG
jgi:hypothetical protein